MCCLKSILTAVVTIHFNWMEKSSLEIQVYISPFVFHRRMQVFEKHADE